MPTQKKLPVQATTPTRKYVVATGDFEGKLARAVQDIAAMMNAICHEIKDGHATISVSFGKHHPLPSITVFQDVKDETAEFAAMDKFHLTRGEQYAGGKAVAFSTIHDSTEISLVLNRKYVPRAECQSIDIRVCADMSPEEKLAQLERAQQAVKSLEDLL